MWMLFMRAPRPDAPDWLGRRWFAAVDALIWPALGAWLLARVPGHGGVVVPLLTAVFVLVGARRVFTALFENRRYHFTTLRWGRPLLWLLALGFVMKSVLRG